MFSGIIEEVGIVQAIEHAKDDLHVTIGTSPQILVDLHEGSSLAVQGICLTLVRKWDTSCVVVVTQVTHTKTTATRWRVGTRVNLERSLPLGSRNEGHMVQGHVSGCATVAEVTPTTRGLCFYLAMPPALLQYVVPEGSISVDGVSLTIASIEAGSVGVNIIPYTATHTTLGEVKVGDILNIETDIIGRYVVDACRHYIRNIGSGNKIEE